MEFQRMLRLILTHGKKSQQESGFTLIELMIVILIVGILATIALPSLMGQIGKARETESKIALSAIAKNQQLYFAEHQVFADQLEKLEIGFARKYYSYPVPQLSGGGEVVKQQAIAQNAAANNIRNYGLGVYHNNGVFKVIICQSLTPDTSAEAPNTPIGSCISGEQLQ